MPPSASSTLTAPVSSGKYSRRIAKTSSIASLVHRSADLQATNEKGESPIVFALAMNPSQWEAALQLLDLQPAGFVPSDKLITTALACAGEEPNAVQSLFLSRILTPAMLDRLYRVPGTPLDIGFFQNWHRHVGKSTTPLMRYIVQQCSVSSAQGGNAHAIEGMFVELLNRGATPGGKDSRARTPLHACVFAAMTGSYPHTFDSTNEICVLGDKWPETRTQFPFHFISILLSRAASLDARDHKGLTPLEYALEKSSKNATRAAKIEVRARNVVRLVLLLVRSASGGLTSPPEDVKRRLVGKLGVEILAWEDPLKARLGGGGTRRSRTIQLGGKVGTRGD
ncbi:hypothetical protein B0T18DRAFT_386864 [Schizothecium vesticola]|uniref:Ankyrin n=1 Tax=Schizothecium vesticola TaxID=314040 RepID=A0AA40KDN5_9PEZI|nr:hypothetical protein B0T18DRAFT_386864 [Schizothecium vesticola]